MKSKKIITALLLIAVVGIWGYVGYSFFKGSGDGGEPDALEDDFVPHQVSSNKFAKQSLKLNYTDPFLRKKEVKPVVKSGIKPVTVKKEEKKDIPVYAWPDIVYKGLILNQSNNNKKLAIVVVNGKESIIREGEMIADVRVMTFDKSKVEMKHEKESRVFLK